MPFQLPRVFFTNPLRRIIKPLSVSPSPFTYLSNRLIDIRQTIAIPSVKDILEHSILRVSTFRRKKTKVRKSRRKQKIKKLKRKSARKIKKANL